MCLCIHIYALCMGLHMHMCEHLCGCEKTTCVIVCILKQGLSLAWSLPGRLDWLASEPRLPPVPASLVLLLQAYPMMHSFFSGS